jgi:predicted DNA-binding transcriptional regulator YafY
VQGLENASVRALTKLEQVLPSRLRYRVRTLSQATVPLLTDQQPGVDPENLAVLAAATANRERVGFRYESADGTESRRMVEPHGLVSAGRRWYLVAYDTG